jgi:subtilisin family serine protease
MSVLISSLTLSACLSKKSSGAASGSLPFKTPSTPLISTFLFSASEVAEPNDPEGFAGSQYEVFEALRASSAWHKQTDCGAIRIGVVDSGVDTVHPDLIDNLEGVGRNFINGTTDVMDGQGHGTHVAGLIAAEGNNGLGTTGVCWRAKLIVAKVTDDAGSAFLSDVVDGLEWVLDNNARVVNISMGTYVRGTTLSEHNQFEDAFAGVTAKAEQKDALIVAAAGNAGANSDIHRTYPANLVSSRVIAVANNLEGQVSQSSGDAIEALYVGSNYGGRTVHVSAPGFALLSTVRNCVGSRHPETKTCLSGNFTSMYDRKSGTSMAAPLVTGTLALMWNRIGVDGISGAALSQLFLNYLEPHTTGSLGEPGKFLLTGAKLDMGNALEAAAQYP